jgi:endonuclease YncB( thermonuclease family)
MLLLLITLLAALTGAAPSHAAIRTVTGTVTKISDGDTIRVITPEHTKLKVRLYGIDAPETPRFGAHSEQSGKVGQHYAAKPTEALEGKITWQ